MQRLRPARVRVDSAALLLWAGAAGCGAWLGLGAAWAWAWPLSLAALAGLCTLVVGASRRSASQGLVAVTLGWAAWQLAGTGWVALAVRDGAHTTAWQLVVLLVLLVLQTLPAVLLWWLLDRATRSAGGQARDRDALHLLLRFGLTLAGAETLRQFGWWGSGYAALATAFVDAPGARWVVPVIGAAGWGWLVWGAAAALAGAVWFRLAGARRARRWSDAAVLLATVAGLGLWALDQQPRPGWMQTSPAGEVVALAVQPPAERGRRWTREARDEALVQLEAALRGAAPDTVLVTAETFFPEPPPRVAEGGWLDLVKLVRTRGVHVLVGMPHLLRDDAGVHLMNAVVQLSPDRQSLYAKERLVPGGEYLPWPETLGPVYAQVFEKVRTGQQAGPPELRQPLFAAGQAIGASICHELSFALTMADRAREANWLVNLADDVWIDDGLYRQQMLSVARLRALEAGKPLLRVSQGAASMLVSPDGEVLAQAGDAGAHVLPVQLQARQGLTPYHRLAGGLASLPLVLAGAWCLVALARRPRTPRTASPT
ncbi:MAG: apolipoprotein N-acyltransferase [Burkholderiaceae bacterium]